MPLSATDLKQRRQQHAILQPYRSVLSNDLAKDDDVAYCSLLADLSLLIPAM
jgi:hypothetical protein